MRRLLTILALLFAFSSCTSREEPEIVKNIQSIQQLLQEGQIALAETETRALLRDTEAASGKNAPDTALVMDLLVEVLWRARSTSGPEILAVAGRALEIREQHSGGQDSELASSLNNYATLLLVAEEYEKAKPYFERAVDAFKRKDRADARVVATCLNNLGGLYQKLGDLEAAEKSFREALAMREATLPSDSPGLVSTRFNLASLLVDRALRDEDPSLFPEARGLFEAAERVWSADGYPHAVQKAAGMTLFAWLLYHQGERDRARKLYEEALEVRGTDHPHSAWTLNNLAILDREAGDDVRARERMTRALEIRKTHYGERHREVAHSLSSLAALELSLGNAKQALDYALDAETLSRDHLSLMIQTFSERQALGFARVRDLAAVSYAGLDIAESAIAGNPTEKDVRRVWNELSRSRALVLDEMAERHRQVAILGSDPEVAGLRQALGEARQKLARALVRGSAGVSTEKYRENLDALREKKEGLEEKLARKTREARGDATATAAATPALEALPADWSLVSYSRYRRFPTQSTDEGATIVPSYLAFVLPAPGARASIVDLGPAAKIDGLVADWLLELGGIVKLASEAERTAAETRLRKIGTTLRTQLWDPVAQKLDSAARVLVIPDGDLHRIPLGALPSDAGRYLVETGPLIHYLSAERDLLMPAKAKGAAGLLAIGNPAFDTPASELRDAGSTPCLHLGNLRFGTLPETANEIARVSKLWKQTRSPYRQEAIVLLEDREATEDAFKEHASGQRFLHLATHGFFLDRRCKDRRSGSGLRGFGLVSSARPGAPAALTSNPLLLSGFALAGANRRASAPDAAEDGILTAEEIASLDLSGVEWAVLSACETGRGKIEPGEGVLGLRRAFQIAGARTLIMSLWSVEDESTLQWMDALYRARLVSGLRGAEAIRRASQDILRARRQAQLNTHPFFWAAFVAAGDWR